MLIDVDSIIPNLALMKLSHYLKKRRKRVILAKETGLHWRSRHVYASSVFQGLHTESRIRELRSNHGDSLQIGGTGVDPALRLPDEIESLIPDYSLYPGMSFGIGFLTRGCPHRCSFCIVPHKDGDLRKVADLDAVLSPGWNRLVLLDDNLLAYHDAAALLRGLIHRCVAVNFNQTLDIRYIDETIAKLLLQTDSRDYSFKKRLFYFSLNSKALIEIVREKLALLKDLKSSELRFVCMYGYDTSLSDDIARFSFLCQRRISPFTQKFQPIQGIPTYAPFEYFDCDPEPLAHLHFPQNGRNFERFLKWAGRKYAEQFGRLYMPLVDRIFQYNFKYAKAHYINTLAGTRDSSRKRRISKDS